MTFSFFLRSLSLLIIFRRNIVGVENAVRKLKIHKKRNKHKQLLSSLYVYRRYVNCGVGDENVC
jgi:hypothetical protein